MMRQIGLLPSGCQIGQKGILHATNSSFYYASTLALYIIDAKTFGIEKILALGEKQILAIVISMHDKNRLISISIDGYLLLWNIQEGIVSNRLLLQLESALLEWDHFVPERCLVGKYYYECFYMMKTYSLNMTFYSNMSIRI